MESWDRQGKREHDPTLQKRSTLVINVKPVLEVYLDAALAYSRSSKRGRTSRSKRCSGGVDLKQCRQGYVFRAV